jgi:3-methyladenine DNA glycosylase AlkD
VNPEDLLGHIRARLKKLGTAQGREAVQRFFKQPVKPYGVAAPQVKKLEQEVWRQVKGWSVEDRNWLCTESMKSGMIEEGVLVCYLYRRLAKTFGESEFSLFGRWIDRYVRNWAHCDGIAAALIAAAIENEPALIFRLFPWTTSRNRWKRRAAAVSLVREARRGRHIPEILQMAEALIRDEDEMVQKGVGWLLKEAYPPNPEPVVAFLLRWRACTARLVLRYAAEKMTPGDRRKVLRKAQ